MEHGDPIAAHRAPPAPRRPRPLRAALAVVVLAVTALGCGGDDADPDDRDTTPTTTTAPAREGCGETLEAAVDPAAPSGAQRMVLVDRVALDQAAVDTMTGFVRSDIAQGVADHARLTLVVDQGSDGELLHDPCLDGTRAFRADDPEAAAAVVEAIVEEIGLSVREAGPPGDGSPLRLLQEASRSTGGDGQAHPVTLLSDLIGDDGSCFDPGDVPLEEADAAALVAGCDIDPIQGDLRLSRVSLSARSIPREQLAFGLADEVCAELAAGECITG